MKKTFYFILASIISSSALAQSPMLQSFIKDYAIKHQFNGTILIQDSSKIIYHHSYGIANREFDVPLTNETLYKICSITKTFTAVLILQLVEQGKITLNEKLHTYLPDYKGEAAKLVKISQLLNHTSGIANTDTVKSWSNAFKYGVSFYQKPYTLKQVVDNFCSSRLVNKPGEKFDYNNADYMILGRIIEKIYSKPFEQVLNEQLLIPLGMQNSGLITQDKLIKALANSYFTTNLYDHLIPDLPFYTQDLSAAGAMYSTTSDLLKFWNALFNLTLIKKPTLDLMLNPGLDDYGFSVWIRDYKGENTKYKRMERYGTLMGANTVVFRYLNHNTTVIILSNTNLTDLGDFALSVGKQIF